ncbi:MAG: CPBP family intramembrane metalloprotease [Acidimicrobiia bacterium]|nr:CPBP family intramembrane metalloprotease [Acidimicrobiia bacterium]
MYTPPAPTVPSAPEATPPAPGSGHHIPRTVVTAIGLGVVLQVVDYVLTRGLHLQNPTAVGLGLGLTLAFYLVVLSLVQGRLYEGKVQPVWHIGSPGPGALVGIAVGAALAGLVILANSALAGHLTSDATAMMVFAQGGLIRVLMLIVVTVVCAPFIEELLFRGLLAESLRPRGRGAAIWLSALAFALWHLRPELLRYYLLIGALLGLLYWKRGLVCSMSAHATFNGLLTLVAALAVTGAGHTVAGAGVTLSAPAGWQQVTSAAGGPDESGLVLHSPSGASVFVQRLEIPATPDPNAIAARMNSVPTLGPGVVVKAGTVHPVQYPAGAGASAEVDDNGHDADAVVISSQQGTVIAELITGGNSNARPQFDSMLQSLQIG